MGPHPFAFSVSHFISSVGSDVGFASIIGLAILVLLYFAHAREISSLREQALESAQRADQLEARLAQLGVAARASQKPGVAPAPAANPVAAASAAAPASAYAQTGDPAGSPAPPAGVGAPSLSAATRLIPAASAASGAAAATVTPAPATPAGGAPTNGTGESPALPPAAGGRPPAPPPVVKIRPGAPATAPRPAGGVRPLGLSSRSGDLSRRDQPGLVARMLPLLIAALIVAAIVALLLILTGGGSKQAASTSTSSTATTNAPVVHRPAPAKAVNPASVTVAVLNGTPTGGLARRVATKLSGAGYKQGSIATASDATHTATIVAYLPGHKSDALAVARALKLGPASVQPVDTNTQQVACPPPSPCSATVVVTVGADLKTQ